MIDWQHIFSDFPTLETARCILRKPRKDDSEALFRLMGDEAVTRYLGRHPLATLQQADERIQLYWTAFESQIGKTWMIVDNSEQVVIGTCGLFNLRRHHARAEIGYALIPSWWGKGITSEVVAEVLRYGFEVMQLHSVEAQLDPENIASKRVLEKHGFVQEAYFREDFYHPVKEMFTDTAVYSLLATPPK